MPQPSDLQLNRGAGDPIEQSVDIRKRIGASGRRGAALAAAVLTLGVATGGAASVSLALAEQDATSAELALRTAAVRGALDTTFQRYADTMHDLVAASPAAVSHIVGERLYTEGVLGRQVAWDWDMYAR